MLETSEIKDLTALARLAVPPPEWGDLSAGLVAILDYVSQLKSAPTGSGQEPLIIPPVFLPGPSSTVWRADEPAEALGDPALFFGEGVNRCRDLVVVPSVRQ